MVGESQLLIGEQAEARYRGNFGPKMVVESAVDVWKIDRQTGEGGGATRPVKHG